MDIFYITHLTDPAKSAFAVAGAMAEQGGRRE